MHTIHRLVIVFAIAVVFLIAIFYVPKNLFQQPKMENEDNGKFYSKPIPESSVPVVEIVNQSFSKTHVNITKNWRVRFVNKDNVTYTLVIEDLGIEEKIYPEDTAEPTFFRKGNITFWIKELGINVTNGTVDVK